MRISIHLSPGTTVISPDPAIVNLGESVSWLITVAGGTVPKKLMATVYFERKSPFPESQFRHGIQLATNEPSIVEVDAGPTQQRGDYKYGVKVEHEDGLVIDVDPFLIVR